MFEIKGRKRKNNLEKKMQQDYLTYISLISPQTFSKKDFKEFVKRIEGRIIEILLTHHNLSTLKGLTHGNQGKRKRIGNESLKCSGSYDVIQNITYYKKCLLT